MTRQRGNRRINDISNIEETTSANCTRQLRSATHIDKFYNKLFKVYLTECEKTRELIKQENE